MEEKLTKRQMTKLVYGTFYMRSLYIKILKDNNMKKAEKLQKMADLFYLYFDKAFDEAVKNDINSIKMLNLYEPDENKKSHESIEQQAKNHIVRLKTLEVADFLTICKPSQDDLSKLTPAAKELFNLSVSCALDKIEEYNFEMLDRRCLQKHREEQAQRGQ